MSAPQQMTRDPEVAAYARQVREALADVPAARLEELLEDLEGHLVEVAAETPGPLTDRLGPAGAYAAELRRATGLPEVPPETAPEVDGRRWDLQKYRARLEDSPVWQQLRTILPELRPAWWICRAWAAVAAVDAVLTGSVGLPLPTLGLGIIGWLVTGAAIFWSVRLGLRARADGQPLGHWAAFANLALVACVVIAIIGLADRGNTAGYEPASYDPGPTTLVHEDGTPITNIVPYSSDGEPLTGVLLYDQDGRPIENVAPYTAEGDEVAPRALTPPQPGNAYPQQQLVVTYDEYGVPRTEVFPAPTPQDLDSGPTAEPSPPAETGPTSAPESSPESTP